MRSFESRRDSFRKLHCAGVKRSPACARVTRARAHEHFSAAQMSFLNESRRLSNERMKRELRLKLARPTIREGLADA